MSTLRELIEKHGPLPLKMRRTHWNPIESFEAIFCDHKYAYGKDETDEGDYWNLIDDDRWELFLEPPKPIVFECEWKDSNLIHPFREDIRVLLNPIVGKKTRVTVEVLPESEKSE